MIVNSRKLKLQIERIIGVVPKNPILPVLESIYFDIEGGVLTLTATDLETHIVTKMSCNSNNKQSFIVPATTFYNLLKGLPEQELQFDLQLDKNRLKVKGVTGEYVFAIQDSEDYVKTPQLSEDEEPIIISTNSDTFAGIIEHTQAFVSKDMLRPSMAGITLAIQNDCVEFMATDAHKLSLVKTLKVAVEDECKVIIPPSAFANLKKLIKNSILDLTISISKTHAFFHFGEDLLISKLIDAQILNYDAVIPKGDCDSFIVNLDGLKASMTRVFNYANVLSSEIRIRVSNDTISVSASNDDFQKRATEQIPCKYPYPKELHFAVSYRNVKTILDSIDATDIEWLYYGKNKPLIVNPVGQEDDINLKMLAMPLTIS